MDMKIFALTCGRKNANCEILVKEALNAAHHHGAEVEMVRLLDLDIKPCRICWPCPAMLKGPEGCIHKDDGPFLLDRIMECDGFILAAPVYSLTPPGYLLAIRDRILGPRADVASLNEVKKMGHDPKFEKQGKMYVDERLFKRRVGALISVGGAATRHWTSLGLPVLHTLTFSALINIVDQMDVIKVAEDGAITLREDLLERARRLGRNLVEAYNNPDESKAYLGDDGAVCPVCNTSLMMMYKGQSYVECSVCGIRGEVVVNDGKLDVVFTEKDKEDSRYKYRGLKLHHDEVFEVSKEIEPFIKELPERMSKYKEYDKWILKPPSKEKKVQNSEG